MDRNDYDYLIKILLLGDSGVITGGAAGPSIPSLTRVSLQDHKKSLSIYFWLNLQALTWN